MGFEIELGGLRALVTGAGQGVGEGIAKMLAAAGAEVAVNDVAPDRASAVVDAIVGAGGKAVAALFDVTDYDAVVNGIEAVGGVDVLVNNAGNAGTAGWAGLAVVVDTKPDDWEMYIRVNFYGVMYCVRAALPAMIEKRWGRIITIISDAGRTGESHMAAYCGAKAGAAGFCRGVAHEVGRYGVTVNNIALGTMRTPISAHVWDNIAEHPEAKAIMQRYIVRRPGEPEDIAGLALYLASPLSSWITGQTYPVNGGISFAL
ncbi:MAG TPA: SDR family oxidoreductase [Acidimicrobiales bacterium]|nr:SDR family oxidoreductase [Acidimicrobiales bacterium]